MQIFNEIHLRLRNERVGFVAVYLYYAPYKIVLTAINILSCYYSLYKYARYFAKRYVLRFDLHFVAFLSALTPFQGTQKLLRTSELSRSFFDWKNSHLHQLGLA